MTFLARLWSQYCLRRAEGHRDAAWEVWRSCENYRRDRGPKGFHDSLTCRYCNDFAQLRINERDRWYERYDRICSQ